MILNHLIPAPKKTNLEIGITMGSHLGTNSFPNGLPMHADGLILGEDGATACTDLAGVFWYPDLGGVTPPFFGGVYRLLFG